MSVRWRLAAAAFWSAFMPAFWSGIAYSLICGLIVGLGVGVAVLMFQRGVENRAASRLYAREWALKLNPLQTALAQEDVIRIDSAVRAMPVAAASALQVLQDAPLWLWRDSLGTQAILIDRALALQKRASEFNGIAVAVDEELHRVVRTHNFEAGIHPGRDSAFKRYAVGKVFEVDDAQLLPWLAIGDTTGSLLQGAWAAVQQSETLVSRGTRLRAARASVSQAANELRHALDA